MPVDSISLDYEGRSPVDLKKRGLDPYTAHPDTRCLMGAYRFNDRGPVIQWEGPTAPREVAEALADPHVEKWAFNAQFERVFTRRVMKIKTPIQGWRCTMALAYMQSFTGTLDMIGRAVGLPEDKQKLATGSKLINLFCKPQKVTARQPIEWRDDFTNPVEWEEFLEYNRQDVITETAIKSRLIRFPVPPEEWALYEIDQAINDRGLPIDSLFVTNAIRMVAIRKAELKAEMIKLTKLANPLSGPQLLPWLQEQGYPFSDLQKATVKKVLAENEEAIRSKFAHLDKESLDAKVEAGEGGKIAAEAVKGLKLRAQAVRTSTAKYNAISNALGKGDNFRFGFQYAGASRTGRWAGRRLNPQNLTRTPAEIEDEHHLEHVTETIRQNDYDGLSIYVKEPMDALAGTVRSAIRAPKGYQLLTCDLSAIETCVIAWLAGCERMLNVVRSGKDPYKDFGTELYSKAYDDITKLERTNSKPAVLGAGYRLGGGDLKEGKRTGLWGYAESMGISLSKDESHRAVKLFRETYPEYPKLWYALEDAAKRALRTGRPTVPLIRQDDGTTFKVPVRFEFLKPYLTIVLPVKNESGVPRRLFYHLPRVQKREMTWPDGGVTVKEGLTYMGQPQGTRKWVRIDTHGGKITENIVQAIARDILAVAMARAEAAGFNLRGHVHDELIALQKIGDNYFTAERLREIMVTPIPGLEGLPLGSSAEEIEFYRK